MLPNKQQPEPKKETVVEKVVTTATYRGYIFGSTNHLRFVVNLGNEEIYSKDLSVIKREIDLYIKAKTN